MPARQSFEQLDQVLVGFVAARGDDDTLAGRDALAAIRRHADDASRIGQEVHRPRFDARRCALTEQRSEKMRHEADPESTRVAVGSRGKHIARPVRRIVHSAPSHHLLARQAVRRRRREHAIAPFAELLRREKLHLDHAAFRLAAGRDAVVVVGNSVDEAKADAARAARWRRMLPSAACPPVRRRGSPCTRGSRPGRPGSRRLRRDGWAPPRESPRNKSCRRRPWHAFPGPRPRACGGAPRSQQPDRRALCR